MSIRHSDPAWEQSIAELLEKTGASALTLRDSLAARDREALVRSLGTALLSESTEPDKRLLASWLFKDLASPGAVPFLAEAFCAPFATPDLQRQILEVLERTAFGGPLPELDLAALQKCLRDQKHIRQFMDLVASVGTQEAKEMLDGFALDRSTRATLVSNLALRPEPWVDSFLEQLLSKLGDDPAVKEAIDERARRTARLKGREFSAEVPASLGFVRPLWVNGQFATLLRLAEEDALAPDALTFLSSATASQPLSKGQRKLFAKLKAAVTSSSSKLLKDS